MQTYKIVVYYNIEANYKSSLTVNCNRNIDILTAMCNAGIVAPYSCRTGTCSACVALVATGAFVQQDQSFLSEDQVKAGYILTCVAVPISNSTIFLNKEMDLY